MRLFRSALLLFMSCSITIAQEAPPMAPTPTDQAAPPTSSATPVQPHSLLDGTPIKLRLSQSISSSDAKVGQEIPFEVIEDVKVDDAVVLPKGSTAIGTVTEANSKRSMGRAGKLNISISYARLADQEKVALRAMKDTKGGNHVGAMTGAMVATSIIFFPAAPLFLFIHGKDISIPQGTEITAYVQGDMRLDMTRFGVTSSMAQSTSNSALNQASLIIESTPPGADVEIDGSFVGNTPSTITLVPGSHDVAVKKKGFSDWMRKLNVTGGSVHLNAELEAAPAR